MMIFEASLLPSTMKSNFQAGVVVVVDDLVVDVVVVEATINAKLTKYFIISFQYSNIINMVIQK